MFLPWGRCMISIDRRCLDPSSDFRRNPQSYLDLQFRTEKVGEPNVKGKAEGGDRSGGATIRRW